MYVLKSGSISQLLKLKLIMFTSPNHQLINLKNFPEKLKEFTLQLIFIYCVPLENTGFLQGNLADQFEELRGVKDLGGEETSRFAFVRSVY